MMKRLIIILVAVGISFTTVNAQRCIEIKTSTEIDKAIISPSAQQSYKDSHTKTNDIGIAQITDYGDNYEFISSFADNAKKQLDDANKSYADALKNGNGATAQANPAAGQYANLQAIAAQTKGMTEEQKKAYIMSHMNDIQQASGASSQNLDDIKKESPAAAVIQEFTNFLATDPNLKKLDLINQQEKAELDAVPKITENDFKSCPIKQGIGTEGATVRSYDVNCVSKAYIAYFQKQVAIVDKYNQQKITIYNQALPQVKDYCKRFDDIVTGLNYGDALSSSQYKAALMSSQGMMFTYVSGFGKIVNEIRQGGADVYVNYDNSVKGVYTNNVVESANDKLNGVTTGTSDTNESNSQTQVSDTTSKKSRSGLFNKLKSKAKSIVH